MQQRITLQQNRYSYLFLVSDMRGIGTPTISDQIQTSANILQLISNLRKFVTPIKKFTTKYKLLEGNIAGSANFTCKLTLSYQSEIGAKILQRRF